MNKLLVFDSHPVQYRVPVWKEMEELFPGSVHVVYASDCSVKGYNDKDFGTTVAWDEPLLDGYSYSILNSEKGIPLSGWQSLTGAGVKEAFQKYSPTAILLTGLNYKFDFVVYMEALRRRIPIWLRCENQDQAFDRGMLKSLGRKLLYRLLYSGIKKFFFIGELNRLHYIHHGVRTSKLFPARYCTFDRFEELTDSVKRELRKGARANAGIPDSNLVIGFSGKFISKKNPGILFSMLRNLNRDLLRKITIYFIGSGELENELKQQAANASREFGVQTFFGGFINQTQLPEHYLAMDILILPSRKMGETWGLVANEAMQAGCGVIVSDAVGCSADFKSWDRFSIFQENDENALAGSVLKLSGFERDFNWATQLLREYSVNSVARSFLDELLANYKITTPTVING